MIKVKENRWLLEGIANETAKMNELWETLMEQGIFEDHDAVRLWKSSFKDILEAMDKQCDEMEDALKELDEDSYHEWLLSFPDDSPPEAPKSVII